jgi:hypothetical protein
MFIFANVHTVLAKTWIEDFNDGNLDAWKNIHTFGTTWQAEEGHLKALFELPVGPLIFRYKSSLEFTGFRLNAEQIRVKVSVLETHNGKVGIFIGQYDNNGFVSRRTYKFFNNWILGPIEFPDQQPDTKFDIKEIEIHFEKGHLQLLSEGKRILEFDEPNLPTIDCVGIIIFTHQVRHASFQLDNFIISGPTVPAHGTLDVRPKGKAAVLWGELKRD